MMVLVQGERQAAMYSGMNWAMSPVGSGKFTYEEDTNAVKAVAKSLSLKDDPFMDGEDWVLGRDARRQLREQRLLDGIQQLLEAAALFQRGACARE